MGLIDDTAAVQVWMRHLSYTWQHPIILDWLRTNGLKSRHDLNPEQMSELAELLEAEWTGMAAMDQAIRVGKGERSDTSQVAEVPEIGDWQFHILTAATFRVTKRTRDRTTSQVYLFDDDKKFPLSECDAPPELSLEAIQDVYDWVEGADSRTLGLIRAVMSKVFSYPPYKRQVWDALPPELKDKLRGA